MSRTRTQITITTHRRARPLEAEISIQVNAFWVRAGLFGWEAPGSHMIDKHITWWRTTLGSHHGWNARSGRWPKPCLTLLLHYNREHS